MNGESITLTGIEKRYGDYQAVADTSFDIGAGEFVSLLGPSGSGKTTLLMMIAGFEMPSTGKIRVGERDITRLTPNRRDIGMVFQRYALFPHMTVAENIGFPLKMRKRPRTEIASRVAAMLDMIQLNGLGARYPQQLSGGQQQRVAVARALIFEPPVLLMDEPLSALDKQLRESMQFEIKRLQQRLGVTVVYVTHDQQEAMTLSDRVAVMSGGRIVEAGTPIELYQRPHTPFVADFVGKMNFIDGTFLGADDGMARVGLSPSAVLASPLTRLNGTANLLTIGGPVRAAIRPEHLRIVAPGAGGRHGLPACVDTAIFAGAFHILLVRIDGRDQLVQVHVPAGAEALPFRAGDAVSLIPDPDAIRLFPVGAGTHP